MKISYKYLTPSLLVVLLGLSSMCRADSVSLGVDGHLYGSYALGANQSVSETFTLDQNTRVNSLTFGISPEGFGMMFNGSYQITLTGANGIEYMLDEQSSNGSPNFQIVTPLPSILSAGDYDITFTGGACGTPCYGPVAGIDYYNPGFYQGLGGSAQGPFGFDLFGEEVSAPLALNVAGNNVPEPASLVLAATALAFIPLRRYWLSKS